MQNLGGKQSVLWAIGKQRMLLMARACQRYTRKEAAINEKALQRNRALQTPT